MLYIANLGRLIDLTEAELRDLHGEFISEFAAKGAELASAPTGGEIIAKALDKAKKRTLRSGARHLRSWLL